MTIYLISDGTNDVVSLPSGSTSNAGASSYTWWIKGTLRVAPSGLCGILGTSAASSSNGFVTNATLQLRVYTASSNRYGTGDNFFEVGVYHHYRLEHDSGGAWRAYRDDMVTPVASGTYSTSTAFSSLNQMFRSSSASANRSAWDMEEMGITSDTFSETYSADLSGGAGSILPTVSGNNNGTLVNFPTDGRQWGSTGDSLTFAGTLPKLTAAISAAVTSGIGATFSGTLPKLTAAISADVTYGISASFAGTLPKLRASINATVSTGTDSLSFSGTLPKLTASISATVSAAPNSISFAGTMPKLRASISATVSLPPPLVAFSGTLPRLRMQAAMTIQVPEPAGDPLALKQALVNARRAEENRNNEYVPPVVIVPEWYIIQQRALGLKQGEANRARDEE
jgi:hypothetical protein